MSLISRENEGEYEWGEFIEPVPYCTKNYLSENCKKFHDKVAKGDGFVLCPYGMSIYVSDEGIKYFSFRERKNHHANKNKRINEGNGVFNPVMDEQQLLKLIQTDMEVQNVSRANRLLEINRSSVHEIKQLNAQIREKSDDLIQKFDRDADSDGLVLSHEEIKKLIDGVKTILVSSSMISSRFLLFDYEYDPERLTKGSTFECSVYKKFDKIRKIFHNYLRKGVPINMSGSSYHKIKAYSSFELIPLLLVENAVKYSLDDNSEVIINFSSEVVGEVVVSISSVGPYCTPTEIKHVLEKGYRGKNASSLVADGSGIGLFFVKTLCDIHGIDIELVSQKERKINISGIEYAPFVVKLTIHNAYE